MQADGPEGGRATTARQGVGKNGRFEESEEDGRCSSFIVERSVVRFLDLHFPLDFLCFFTPFWDCFWTLFKSFVDYFVPAPTVSYSDLHCRYCRTKFKLYTNFPVRVINWAQHPALCVMRGQRAARGGRTVVVAVLHSIAL